MVAVRWVCPLRLGVDEARCYGCGSLLDTTNSRAGTERGEGQRGRQAKSLHAQITRELTFFDRSGTIVPGSCYCWQTAGLCSCYCRGRILSRPGLNTRPAVCWQHNTWLLTIFSSGTRLGFFASPPARHRARPLGACDACRRTRQPSKTPPSFSP